MQSLEHIIIVIISRFSWSFHGLSTPIDDNLHHRHHHQAVLDIVEASVQAALDEATGAMGDIGDELLASLAVLIDAVEENLQTFSPFFNTTPIVETSLSSFDDIKNIQFDTSTLELMMVPELVCKFPEIPVIPMSYPCGFDLPDTVELQEVVMMEMELAMNPFIPDIPLLVEIEMNNTMVIISIISIIIIIVVGVYRQPL